MRNIHSDRKHLSAKTRVLLGAVSALAISLGVVADSAAVTNEPSPAGNAAEGAAPTTTQRLPGEIVAVNMKTESHQHKTQAIYMKYGSHRHKTQAHHIKLESGRFKVDSHRLKIESRQHKTNDTAVGWSWASHQHKTQANQLKLESNQHKAKGNHITNGGDY